MNRVKSARLWWFFIYCLFSISTGGLHDIIHWSRYWSYIVCMFIQQHPFLLFIFFFLLTSFLHNMNWLCTISDLRRLCENLFPNDFGRLYEHLVHFEVFKNCVIELHKTSPQAQVSRFNCLIRIRCLFDTILPPRFSFNWN